MGTVSFSFAFVLVEVAFLCYHYNTPLVNYDINISICTLFNNEEWAALLL